MESSKDISILSSPFSFIIYHFFCVNPKDLGEQQSTFLPNPNLYLLMGANGSVASEGTEKTRGDVEPPDFHFTPAVTSWSCSFD